MRTLERLVGEEMNIFLGTTEEKGAYDADLEMLLEAEKLCKSLAILNALLDKGGF